MTYSIKEAQQAPPSYPPFVHTLDFLEYFDAFFTREKKLRALFESVFFEYTLCFNVHLLFCSNIFSVIPAHTRIHTTLKVFPMVAVEFDEERTSGCYIAML